MKLSYSITYYYFQNSQRFHIQNCSNRNCPCNGHGLMSYIVLTGRWCNIIDLNVHAPSEEKSDSSKDSFYEELEQVFDHFPKYDMKILLRDFNAKVGRENIFKPTRE